MIKCEPRGPCIDPDGCAVLGCVKQHALFEAAVFRIYAAQDRPVTMADLLQHLDKLKVTDRQREFIKAAFRALLSCELSVRFNARIDI